MKEEKKILFVTGRLSCGGAERVLVLLANEFANRGYKVSIIEIEKDSEPRYDLNNSIEVIEANLIKSGIGRIFETLSFVRRIVKKGFFSFVISFQLANNVNTLLALMGLKVPIYVSERCDPGNLSKKSDKLYYWLSKVFYHRASGVVFQTEYVKTYYSNSINKKSIVIMNPIDMKTLPRTTEEIKPWILNVGRLSEQKNQQLLIEAFASFHQDYPEYELHILGDGELKNDLLSQIVKSNLSDKVFIHGYVKNVESFYSSAKIFVLTSNYEGIPNAMLEAMAIGVPVICTDCPVGGVALVVRNEENGLLVKPGDKEAIIADMKELIINEDKYERISGKARLVRNDYSIQSIVNKWELFCNNENQ